MNNQVEIGGDVIIGHYTKIGVGNPAEVLRIMEDE